MLSGWNPGKTSPLWKRMVRNCLWMKLNLLKPHWSMEPENNSFGKGETSTQLTNFGVPCTVEFRGVYVEKTQSPHPSKFHFLVDHKIHPPKKQTLPWATGGKQNAVETFPRIKKSGRRSQQCFQTSSNKSKKLIFLVKNLLDE